MPERIVPGPVSGLKDNCEAVCIHTKKIYDSCRDKDCIEDLRFYPTLSSQDVLGRAQTVKGGKAELIYTYIDVEPVVFNRGFYTVDMRFFYRVTLNAYCSCPRPIEVEGLCVFDKRVILFGSEGNAKTSSPPAARSGDALDRSKFRQVDIRKFTEITFDAKKPKVLTSAPQSTYTLTTDGKGKFILHITNPAEFWSISNFLVIQTQ